VFVVLINRNLKSEATRLKRSAKSRDTPELQTDAALRTQKKKQGVEERNDRCDRQRPCE
jgi:hypothetical protein